MFMLTRVGRKSPGNVLPVKKPQIFDLLQLSRKERESRASCLAMIHKLSSWKKNYKIETDHSLKLLVQVEGILLRRQAQDAVILYRMIRKERMARFREYMELLPDRKNLFRTAS